MRYLVISDLHLGDGTKSDDFLYKTNKKIKDAETKLISWILKQNADVILLNGDIFEIWQHSMRKIRKEHIKLFTAIEKVPYEYIIGNHDYRLFGKMNYTFEMADGRKVIVTHGFQNDKKMTNPMARFGVWCLGWVEKIIPNIESFGNFTDSAILKNTTKYAFTLFKTFDVVVLGHTHELFLTTDKGKTYANCGTCQHGKTEGIIIDTKNNKIEKV